MSPKHQESIGDKKDTILCMVSRVPRHQKESIKDKCRNLMGGV